MESRGKEDGLSSEERSGAETKKCCSDCKTTKTPLWRSGPSGPKSLCNACGIRYRKKRPSVAGKARSSKVRDAMKVNLMADLEKEVAEQRSPRQWGEVERAALLLLALSCGAVFA